MESTCDHNASRRHELESFRNWNSVAKKRLRMSLEVELWVGLIELESLSRHRSASEVEIVVGFRVLAISGVHMVAPQASS